MVAAGGRPTHPRGTLPRMSPVIRVRPRGTPPMELLLIVLLVALFEFAAARWGVDSRDLLRTLRH